MSVKRIVIDASVALKWRLRDEEATDQADALADDFLDGRLLLLTPTLFDYEITNALRVAVARGRISQTEAANAVADFKAFSIERCDFEAIQALAFQMACDYLCSAYDSAYLALAQTKGIWFSTGDRRLFNAIERALSWVKWIGDYEFDIIPVAEKTEIP